MTKDQAEALYPLVNSPAWRAFIDHKQAELHIAHKELEWQVGEEAFRTQGRIQEIRRDFELANRVNDLLDQ